MPIKLEDVFDVLFCQAFEETAYLLRSPKNTRRLIESIAQLEEGQGVERGILD